jgi:hypothetical protein
MNIFQKLFGKNMKSDVEHNKYEHGKVITAKNANEYAKIIKKVATQKLKPLGIFQKGQSRIWIDDRVWYSVIIEFQPKHMGRGSFLNIGANFHWYRNEHFSFDLGNRQQEFVEYKNDKQFTEEIEKYCNLVIEQVFEIRDRLSKPLLAKQTILEHTFTSDDLWGNYHKSIICGLTGDLAQFNRYSYNLLQHENEHDAEWIDKLKENMKFLQSKTSDLELFKKEVSGIISETRTLKKLPEIEICLS